VIVVPDFDPISHTYYVDSRIAPSVTQILKCGGFDQGGYEVSEDVMDYARDRGTDIHLACQLLDEDDLDWDALDEEIEPYVLGYARWKEDEGFVPDLIEQAVYCEEYDYCGTLDRAGWIGDQRVVIDLKSGSAGVKRWHPKQLAAYAYCLKEKEWPLRIVVELKATTKKGYTPRHFSPKTAAWDFQVFLACRTLLTDAETWQKPSARKQAA
jgi:hypothetical protein